MLFDPQQAGIYRPNWPAVPGVYALGSLRSGGCSQPPWDSFNLGAHVGDKPESVTFNRALWAAAIAQESGQAESAHPLFLNQVHGRKVAELRSEDLQLGIWNPSRDPADACVTDEADWACTIMVADCLPVLFAHRSTGVVGAAHAGWRGLAGEGRGGVLESVWLHLCALVQQQERHLSEQAIAVDTQVWLGPCIGPQAFEVGDEVYQAFVQQQTQAQECFTPAGQKGKWLADLAALARQRLTALGITAIYGNDSSPPWCTVGNPSRFFSHRRDAGGGHHTGRMALSIWRI